MPSLTQNKYLKTEDLTPDRVLSKAIMGKRGVFFVRMAGDGAPLALATAKVDACGAPSDVLGVIAIYSRDLDALELAVAHARRQL